MATGGSGDNINVTEFKYRYSVSNNACILWSGSSRDPAELNSCQARLNAGGFRTVDLSSLEAAQVRGL